MPTTSLPAKHPENPVRVSESLPTPQGAASIREIWLEHADARLFAVETGQGRPVVFLHGGLADHRAALRRLAPLAARLRLITPDLRGSGRSHWAGELGWDRLADDVAALLSHLGIERAVVGGISMGSAVALRFALRHPHRLQALILMSPVYPGEDRPLAEASSAAMRVMAEAGERAAENGIDALRPLFDVLPSPVRDYALELMQSFDPRSVAATTRFLATNLQPMSAARELEAITVPVMVVPGIDAQHPRELAALYVQHLREPIVVEQTAVDFLEQLGAFCAR
jgi:pimeloyl-ACP methyl ester carboxylesterase